MEADRRELEFLRPLGVGGFGAVYLANLHGRDRFVRRVAVKVMREGLDATPDLVARQKDEARLLGLLAHEGIVQVFDLAEVQGRPAVVMEYVEGVDLSEVIKAIAPRRFPVRAALEVVASVAGALDAAYNSVSALTSKPLRVIHRDIKPANMLLTPSGRVKVLDFGVAKADFARDGHTTNAGWGTPRFMAPEQWLGEPYGSPIDTYALGVTLFDLVADRPWDRPPLSRTPFEAQVAAQLDAQTDVPEDVLSLIAAMTAFDAADRPTAAEVRERAELALANAPGESLARFARTVVPALVEAKSQKAANQPVPGPVTLGTSRPAERTGEPSMVATPTPTVRRAVWGAAAAGVAIFLVLALGLAGATWALVGGEHEAQAAAAPAPTAVPPAPSTDPTPEPAAEPAPAEPLAEPPAVAEAAAPAAPASATASTARRREAPRSAAPVSGAPAAPTATTGASAAAVPVTPPPEPSPTVAARYPATITSVPMGAEVWVAGERVGHTPLPGHQLPAGTHTVELVLEGKRSPPRTFAVGPDATVRLRYDFDTQTWRSVK